MSFLLSLMFSFQKNCGTGSAWTGEGGSGEVTKTMYTHVSKCKNSKIEERKTNQIHFWCIFFFFYQLEGKSHPATLLNC
jgi:hypothetical protein